MIHCNSIVAFGYAIPEELRGLRTFRVAVGIRVRVRSHVDVPIMGMRLSRCPMAMDAAYCKIWDSPA